MFRAFWQSFWVILMWALCFCVLGGFNLLFRDFFDWNRDILEDYKDSNVCTVLKTTRERFKLCGIEG